MSFNSKISRLIISLRNLSVSLLDHSKIFCREISRTSPSMDYRRKRTKFFFLLPLPKKNPWLSPHYNSRSKHTVSANLTSIRTSMFLSAILQVGEQKILYNPLFCSKPLVFSQWTSLSPKIILQGHEILTYWYIFSWGERKRERV